MASFSGELDLMGFMGAKLLQGIDPDKKDRAYICIPVQMNEMSTRQDKNGKVHVSAKFNMWPVSKGIADWWKGQRTQAGVNITQFNIPTHRIELGFSEEYRKRLMERAKLAILAQHKDDWNTSELQDENQNRELKNAIYRMVHQDLCSSVWMHEPKSNVGGYGVPSAAQSVAAAPTSQAWTPNFDADGNMSGGSNAPDDLPF